MERLGVLVTHSDLAEERIVRCLLIIVILHVAGALILRSFLERSFLNDLIAQGLANYWWSLICLRWCDEKSFNLTFEILLSFGYIGVSALVVSLCLLTTSLLGNLRKEHILVVQEVQSVLELRLQTVR